MVVLQWAVTEANLDPVAGSEQKGNRPVLIVSNEEFNQAMPNVTVLPLTSTKRRLYPSEVFLPQWKAGQPLDSIIMAHQIRTISKQRLQIPLGYLEDTQLRYKVREAITEHLDLD
jgi:mRNA interferase MazF